MGTPDFALPSLEALARAGEDVVGVVTQPDRPRGRGRGEAAPPPVKRAALALGLPVLQPERVGRPGAVAAIAALRPELIVVVAFGQILPAALLSVPARGCVNVHASLLPRYRGAAPIHWAILNGELQTGVTTMWMDEGLDTGDLILSRAVPIGPDETVGELHDRLAALGASCLLETLRLLRRGEAPRIPQAHDQASYAPRLTAADERIDWNRPAREIHNRVRGMNPWPVAHALTGRGRLKVWRTRLPAEGAAAGGASAPPGTVVAVRPGDGIDVQASDAPVTLLEVQPAGGRRMPADAYANGRALAPGQAL